MSMTRAQIVRGNLVALAKEDTKSKPETYEVVYSPRRQPPDSPPTGCWKLLKNKFTFFFCSETRRKPEIIAAKAILVPASPAYRSISAVTLARHSL